MTDSEIISWINSSRKKIVFFLEQMSNHKSKSLYKLSLSGDIYQSHNFWGLAQATFVVRIAKILNRLDYLDKQKNIDFILKFKNKGLIYDSLLHKKAIGKKKSILNFLSFHPSIANRQIALAETRQAIAALLNLEVKLDDFDSKIIQKYYDSVAGQLLGNLLQSSLNPWHDSSHLNHLIFFSEQFGFRKKGLYSNKFLEWARKNQNSRDYTFAKSDSPTAMKIGSTMKVFMALNTLNKTNEFLNNRLIDFVLSSEANGDACELFNTIYILKQALPLEYRLADIRNFARSKAELWTKYYYNEWGSFSFFQGKSISQYYGFYVTNGANEPDLHGTAMFYWGFCMLSEILNLNNELKLQEPIL